MAHSRVKKLALKVGGAALAVLVWHMSDFGSKGSPAGKVHEGDEGFRELQARSAPLGDKVSVPQGLREEASEGSTQEKLYVSGERSEASRFAAGSGSPRTEPMASAPDQMEDLLTAAGALVALAAEPVSAEELWGRLESLGFTLAEHKAGHPKTGLRLEWAGAHVSGAAAQAQLFLDEEGKPLFDSVTVTLPVSSARGSGLQTLRESGVLTDPKLVSVRSSDQLVVFRVDDQHRTFWAKEDTASRTVQMTLEQTECEHGVAAHDSVLGH